MIIFKVTQGRISATYEKDKAKSDTFKLFGNGGMINNTLLNYKLKYLRLWKNGRGCDASHTDESSDG